MLIGRALNVKEKHAWGEKMIGKAPITPFESAFNLTARRHARTCEGTKEQKTSSQLASSPISHCYRLPRFVIYFLCTALPVSFIRLLLKAKRFPACPSMPLVCPHRPVIGLTLCARRSRQSHGGRNSGRVDREAPAAAPEPTLVCEPPIPHKVGIAQDLVPAPVILESFVEEPADANEECDAQIVHLSARPSVNHLSVRLTGPIEPPSTIAPRAEYIIIALQASCF